MDEPRRDVHLTLCLTHACNLRCGYCYGGGKSPRHLALSTGRRALDLALAHATKRLHLVFFGGEPLLRWRTLAALTDEARGRAEALGIELRPTLTTNGTLLTEARARWLRDRGFTVGISCDGVAAAHDAHRRDARGRSSHSRTLAGLRRARAAGLKVRVILVLDPANLDRLDESAAFLAGLGADDLVVNPNWSADWSSDEVRERWTAAYGRLAERWLAAYRADRPFWISILDDKVATALKGGYLAAERCDLGRTGFVVAPSGRLYPCDRLVGEDRDDRWVVGDVRSGRDEAKVRELAGRACSLPSECGECALAPRCRNRCACANLALTGTLERPSEVLCFHEQLAIRTADDAAGRLLAERCPAFLRRYGGIALS